MLGDFGREQGCQNVALFVDICTQQIQASAHSCLVVPKVPRVLTKAINPTPIIQGEARMWLAGIRRRIGGRKSIRNPFCGEVVRDTPLELFSIIDKGTRGLDGFTKPFFWKS